MKEVIEVKTREEAKEILSKYNFDKYIYRKEEFTFADSMVYRIEIEDNKVIYCSLDTILNGLLVNSHIFYDIDRINDFKNEEVGERFYKEYEEIRKSLES